MSNTKRKVGNLMQAVAKAIKAAKDDPAKLEAIADQLMTVSGGEVTTQGIALSEDQVSGLTAQGIALSE